MLSISSSSKLSCCSLARQLTTVPARSLSASSTKFDDDAVAAAQPRSEIGERQRKQQTRIFQRVLKAAVVGSQNVRDRQLDPPMKGEARVPDYVDHGFRPTPTRGSVRANVKYKRRSTTTKTPVSPSAGRKRPQAVAYSRSNRLPFSTTAHAWSNSFLAFRPTSSVHQLRRAALEDAAEQNVLLEVDADLDGDLDAPAKVPVAGKGKAKQTPSSPGQLSPGCWIEVRRGGLVSGGILLGRSKVNPRFMLMLSPSPDGESSLQEVQVNDITFVLPQFVSADLARRCTADTPDSELIMSLLQSLRQLEIRIEQRSRLLVANGAHDFYRRVYASSSAAAGGKTLGVDTEKVLEVLRVPVVDKEAHLAAHRMLMDDPLHFIADPVSLRTSGYFKLRSSDELQRFETVRSWVRERGTRIKQFARKAAEVRQQGLGITMVTPPATSSSSSDAPLERVRIGVKWSSEDRQILWFLHDALNNERAIQEQPYMAIAPSIIKSVDEVSRNLGYKIPYAGHDVSRQRIMSFFAEVGVTPPWENWIVHEEQSLLPSWDRMSNWVHNKAQASEDPSAAEAVKVSKDAGSKAQPKAPGPVKPGYYSADAHDSVRHDFQQMAVYTIDDAGAMELDDGISIVPAPPTAGDNKPSWWVHVHIADPTTLLQASHPLSALAKLRDHTEYFPERTWSMLPDWFVIDEKLSLGSRGGKEQPTLTMSMRVSEDGQVLDSDVRVGVVRNVRRLTYAAVDEVLGSPRQDDSTSASLTLGDMPAPSLGNIRQTDNEAMQSDAAARQDLVTLHTLARKMLARRVRDNALYWSFPQASVSVSPSLNHHVTFSSVPSFHTSAPSVKVRLPTPGGANITPAQLLVSEMMVAANRVAAKFSVERGIAVPFRSQAAPTLDVAALERVLACRDPATGEASGQDIIRLGVDFLPGVTGVEPATHWPMGIQDEFGYVKVTSPLRRYADLFTHWQLKSALLPSTALRSAFTPCFTRSAVLQHIQHFENAHKSRGRLSKHAEHFWALYVLKHKLKGASSALPGSVPTVDEQSILDSIQRGTEPALALRTASFSTLESLWIQPVVLMRLGLRATLACKKEAEAPMLGETVNVKVQDIRLGTRSRMLVERA